MASDNGAALTTAVAVAMTSMLRRLRTVDPQVAG
jgi:hypothetical protein